MGVGHTFDTQGLRFGLGKGGSSIAARMAMMAITTSNSINVKPARLPLPLQKILFITALLWSAPPSGRKRVLSRQQ
jgi:hypothetical protein